MSTKEQLLKEIEQSPDYLIEEVLNFLLFVKLRLKQKITTNTNLETHSIQENSILEMIDEITQDIPESELEQLPTDFSKNLDQYLYGLPKVEEILEARKVKNGCLLAPSSGTAYLKNKKGAKMPLFNNVIFNFFHDFCK